MSALCAVLMLGVTGNIVYADNKQEDRAVNTKKRTSTTNSRREQVKKQADTNNGLLGLWNTLTDFVKGRDFLVYAYTEGMLTYEEYDTYMKNLIAHAELKGMTIEEYQLKNKQTNAFRSNADVVEANARLTMYEMYLGIADEFRTLTPVQIDELDNTYGLTKDIWYLCPYGCRAKSDGKWSKVAAWGGTCKETNKSHKELTDKNSSNMRLTTEQILPEGKRINYTNYRCRRDCSCYVSCVLYNLGLGYMWDNGIEPVTMSSYSFIDLKNTLDNSDNFTCLIYTKDAVQPGDIVVKGGHIEVFMGWANKEANEVYHYSWGSSKDVYSILDNGPGGKYFNAFKQSKTDKRYAGGHSGYSLIIRYIGQDGLAQEL